MNIRNTLHLLVNYYSTNRGVGNTTLMKQGVSNFNSPKYVLLINYNQGHDLDIPKNEVITIGTLDKNLMGKRIPIAIDNAVLSDLFDQALTTILDGDTKINHLIEENYIVNKDVKQKLGILNGKYHREKLLKQHYIDEVFYLKDKMENHPFKTFFETLWNKFKKRWQH